ncbi:MAG: hypothetical protein E6J90_22845 [Deltaproteobacteria bacterium]|nr:MAG: hypothetical protein E6J91_21770 [Deltaproteobacteria bacterium]TMQ17068.1 MAG: hypothetical protein E6J90_22845 [Deltaproteobacteria bacterium]
MGADVQVAHALGTGHRRSASKINRSSVISVSAAASEVVIAEQAIAGFHPSQTRFRAQNASQRFAAKIKMPVPTSATKRVKQASSRIDTLPTIAILTRVPFFFLHQIKISEGGTGASIGL